MASLFSELRRRNVYKAGAAYAVVGWILIEVASVLIPAFGAPDWVFRVFALLVVLGFPLAIVFAWAFELTPEGLKRTAEVAPERSITPQTSRKLDFVIIGLLAVALAISVSLNLRGSAEIRDQSIAVLPFTSRSTDPENALFADGVHDELLTNLANIGALKVISRTSVMEYRDTRKNLRQIGTELGVATVLEGAVQRVGDTVRINVQLIDAATDKHIWARSYDRKLTTESIFSIQREIATTIAERMRATLTPSERERLGKVPTANLAAYELYQTGRQNLYERTLDGALEARAQFERAIALDPQFAQAYAALGDTLSILLSNHGAITSEEAFDGASAAIEKALALESQDADIYASLGLLKSNMWQLSRSPEHMAAAEAAFERAIELNPNHAQAVSWYGGLASDRGEYERAIEHFRRSLELDPLARVTRSNLALAYASTGANERALQTWLETVRRHPDWPTAQVNVGSHLLALGRLDEALAWLQRGRSRTADLGLGINGIIAIHMEFGQPEPIIALMRQAPRDHPYWVLAQATIRQLEGDMAGALALLEGSLAQLEHPPIPFLFVASELAMLTGRFETAREYMARLCPSLATDEPAIDSNLCNNGVGYAYVLQQLGETDRATAVLAATWKFLEGHHRLGMTGYGIADVQALTLMGRHDEALVRLREAVDAGWRSAWNRNSFKLQHDPYLEPVRERPEFVALVAEVEADIARMGERVAAAEASGDWQPLLALAGTPP